MEPLIAGITLGVMASSLVANAALYYTRHRSADSWRLRAREAEDAKKATELRSAEQIDAILERMHSPVLSPSPVLAPPVDASATRYIPDTPDADTAWNEFRGEPIEDEE